MPAAIGIATATIVVLVIAAVGGYFYAKNWVRSAAKDSLPQLDGTLAVAGLLLKSPALLPYALIWMNHIGVDRALGYGLKYAAGFQWTHLGKLRGRRAEAIQAS